MKEDDFVLLWKEQYEKTEQTLILNKRLLKETLSQRAESQLKALMKSKARGIAAAVIYLVLLGIMIYYSISHYSTAANYFIVSIGVIFLINVKALYDYIKHLIWLNTIDYSGSIAEIQQKLIRLQLSIIQHIRIMFLQLPFWTTFYLSSQWFPSEVGWSYIIFQLVLTLSFAFTAGYLYKNLTRSNLHKKWVHSFLSGAGGQKVRSALDYYQEIEAFKSGN